jgi:hypothetical protein
MTRPCMHCAVRLPSSLGDSRVPAVHGTARMSETSNPRSPIIVGRVGQRGGALLDEVPPFGEGSTHLVGYRSGGFGNQAGDKPWAVRGVGWRRIRKCRR